MIDKLFRATLDHPKGVLAAALLLCVACALCIPLVKINYQFSDYLPEDSPSTGSLQTLEDAFGANLPNSYIYAPVSYTHLDVYKRQSPRCVRPA